MPTSKAGICHTCRRQRLRCDGAKPTCTKCAARGVECLGYGAQPILWVQPQTQSGESSNTREAPANTKPKGQKKRGRPRLVLMAQTDSRAKDWTYALQLRQYRDTGRLPPTNTDETGLIKTKWSPSLDPADYQKHRLMISSIQYYNDYMCPNLVLLDSPSNPHRVPIDLWHYFPSMMLQILISTTLTHQVIKSRRETPGSSGSASNDSAVILKKSDFGNFQHPSMPLIFKSQLETVKLLNAEMRDPELQHGDLALSVISILMKTALQQSAVGGWPTHFNAAQAIIAQRGGFVKVSEENGVGLDQALASVIILDVIKSVFTATEKLGNETAEQLKYIPLLSKRFKDGTLCGYPCPNQLLEVLIRINHTRHLGQRGKMGDGALDKVAESLLRKIASFSPSKWVEWQFEAFNVPVRSSTPNSSESDASTDAEDEGVQTISRNLHASDSDTLRSMWIDLAKSLQAAVLLYCLQTLFMHRETTSVPGLVATTLDDDGIANTVVTSTDMVRHTALDMLLGALHRLWACETNSKTWCGKYSLWPLFIAGVELDRSKLSSAREKTFLTRSLSRLAQLLGDMTALDGITVLQTFWDRNEQDRWEDSREGMCWVDRLDELGLREIFLF